MWLIRDVWTDLSGDKQSIELECTECGKKISFMNAVGRIIKTCKCEKEPKSKPLNRTKDK